MHHRAPIHPALNPYIAEIWIEDDTPQTDLQPEPYVVYPKPYPVLGFQYRGQIGVLRDAEFQPLASSGVTGIQTAVRRFQADAEARSVLVAVKPYAASALLQVRMDELKNEQIGLQQMGKNVARSLEEQLRELSSSESISDKVQTFLLSLIRSSNQQPHPTVMEAVRQITQSHGSQRIASIADRLAVSSRHLQRLFLVEIGVSPKEFAGLVQFDWVLQNIAERSSWAELAFDAGYADQSHFIREFLARTGTTPGQFSTLSSEDMSHLFNTPADAF